MSKLFLYLQRTFLSFLYTEVNVKVIFERMCREFLNNLLSSQLKDIDIVRVGLTDAMESPLIKWCEDNCTMDWHQRFNSFYFRSKTDAVAFKLRWL